MMGLFGLDSWDVRRKSHLPRADHDPYTGEYIGPPPEARFRHKSTTGLNWAKVGKAHIASPTVYHPGEDTEYRFEAESTGRVFRRSGRREFVLALRNLRSGETDPLPIGPFDGVKAAQEAADELIIDEVIVFKP